VWQTGQLIGGLVDGRDQGGDAETGQGEAGQRGGHRRQREGEAHPRRGERTAGPRHPALAEPVHDAVAGQPADGHRHRQRDEAQPGGRRTGVQFRAQVERAP
jgi:hypothetical protein